MEKNNPYLPQYGNYTNDDLSDEMTGIIIDPVLESALAMQESGKSISEITQHMNALKLTADEIQRITSQLALCSAEENKKPGVLKP